MPLPKDLGESADQRELRRLLKAALEWCGKKTFSYVRVDEDSGHCTQVSYYVEKVPHSRPLRNARTTLAISKLLIDKLADGPSSDGRWTVFLGRENDVPFVMVRCIWSKAARRKKGRIRRAG